MKAIILPFRFPEGTFVFVLLSVDWKGVKYVVDFDTLGEVEDYALEYVCSDPIEIGSIVSVPITQENFNIWKDSMPR